MRRNGVRNSRAGFSMLDSMVTITILTIAVGGCEGALYSSWLLDWTLSPRFTW